MSDDPSPSADSLEEQLVAYLDGELDAENVRRIEALLASDPHVRQTLSGLQRTWDMLEELDTPLPDEKLTQSTLEMVALAAREDAERAAAEAPRRDRRRRIAVAAGVLAVTVAGFLAVMFLVPDPDKQLFEDMPILERLDEYRQIDSVAFLHLLRDKGLFSKENHEDAAEKEPAMHKRRSLVGKMSPAEKEQLQRAQQRFASLELAEQQRLRDLHTLLQKDQDVESLSQTMQRYAQWVKNLPSYGRAELAQLDTERRIEWIEKRLHADHARENEKRLDKKDSDAVALWCKEHAAEQEEVFLKALPKAKRIKLQEMSPAMRQQMLAWQMSQWSQAVMAGKTPPMMTENDLVQLRETLSPDAQKLLAGKSGAEQWRLTMAWVRRAMRPSSGGRLARNSADDDRLAQFFEHDLTTEERDRLLGMSGEEMQRELVRLYFVRILFDEKSKQPPAPQQKK